MNPHFDEHGSPPSFWRSRYAIGLVVIGGVAIYFLLTEHLAHVVGALPYLLLLACPLMHVFMHRGHGGHHHHGQSKPAPFRKTDTRKPGDPS
ncbi:hypothetical protein D3C81_1802680 [compost metagenome]